jgi:uncharacterized protein (TIGR02444 family)
MTGPATRSPGPASIPSDGPDLDNALWRFVLSFYGRDGVSPACLTLQDKLGLDVDILLFAIFAQVDRGILLDVRDLATIDQLVRDWRSEIIQPLRCVRTRLKTGPAPAPSSLTERLRTGIKETELEAEQIALAVLADWLDRQPPRSAAIVSPETIPLMVARYFATPLGEAFAPEVNRALHALSRAIQEELHRRDQSR